MYENKWYDGPRFASNLTTGDEFLNVFKNIIIILVASFGGCFVLGMILYLITSLFGIFGAGFVDMFILNSDPLDNEPDLTERVASSEINDYYYFCFGILISFFSLVLLHPSALFNNLKCSMAVYYATIILRVLFVGIGLYFFISHFIIILGLILVPLGIFLGIGSLKR